MKKLLLMILILQVSNYTIFSQENDIENISHYIGGAAGFSTGYGLSYRYWPGAYGTQVVFSPYSNGEDTTINLGTAILKTLYETKYTRLFLYIAGNGTYNNYVSETWSSPTADETWDTFESELIKTERLSSFNVTAGIGPGLEIYLFTNIVIDVMFGYRYSVGDLMTQEGLGFTAEAALYYRF